VLLYPAIDILRGRVARASRRGPENATVYHEDPLAIADQFAAAGASWLHVVDLDRAFGFGEQTNFIAKLIRRLSIPVQIGGALDSAEAVEEMRDIGVQRVLLHAKTAADPEQLRAIADQFSGESLGLAIDVENGILWGRTWAESARWSAAELAGRAHDAGFAAIVYTELNREGALRGADIGGAAKLSRATDMHVIISGGIDSLDDLRRAKQAGLGGAVVGRALYEHRFSIEEALACCTS